MKNICLERILVFGTFLFIAGCQGIFSPIPDEQENRLRNAIRINPVNETGYIRLAQYLESHQRFSETLSVLHSGQKQVPDSISLIRLEGRLYTKDRLVESLEFYTKQVNLHPDESLLYLDRAQIYWLMKKHESGLNDARKALSLNPDLFEAHFLIGVIFDSKTDSNFPRKSENALDAFIAASLINDQNPGLWLRISTLWDRLGDIHKAILAILRSVELAPESKLYLRHYVILQERALDKASLKNSAEFGKSLQLTLLHMLKLFPDDGWINAHYGNWAWTQGKYSLAEKHLKRSLELYSPYPWANFRLGVVYLSQEKWEHAFRTFEEGLKHDPGNEWAIHQIAYVLEMQEKNEEAIIHYEWLMENAPANLTVVNRLNHLYWEEFLFEQGEDILLRGLEKFPKETKLIEKIVAYYDSRGLYEKAAKILLSFVQTEPGNTAALAKIGFYEKNLKRPENALLWFNKALASSPDFEWASIQKIRILLNAERTEKAENALKGFLKRKPDAEWAQLELSQLKLKQEQYTEAEELLYKSLLQHQDSPVLLETLGRMYKLQERWEEAEKIFNKLVKLRPSNSLLLTHLGFTQWKLKKTEKARLNITQALYENPGSLWAWNLYLLLQPEEQQFRWIGEDFPVLVPALKALASQKTAKAWQKITTVRTDPFTRQVLKNLHYLLEGVPEDIVMHPGDLTSKQLPPWIHEQWGYFHEMLGNSKLAVSHFEAVLEALPDNAWIHTRLGWVHERLGNLEKSKQHYNQFLRKHPQAFDVSFRLANIHALLGNEALTIELYEKIITHRPEHHLVLNNLAWIYLTAQDRQLRNLEKGMKLALKSVDLKPTIDNLDTLAEAYFQFGKRKKAIEVIRKAAREVDYSPNRHSYLRKQLLRFRKGERNSSPPPVLS